MQGFRRTASILAALALAACSDHRDLVAPQSHVAPGKPNPALTTTNGDGGVTASVTGPDNVAPGAVANYNISLTAPTAPSVLNNPLDVVFVLDASGSEGAANYNLEKQAVVSQINDLPVGTTARVGVVRFSTTTTTAYTFTTNQTASAIDAAVSNLSYSAQETFTLDGMNAALNIFTAGERPGSERVIVLLTDGNPNPPGTQNPCGTTTAEQTLRANLAANNISTFVLGVGADINSGTLSCLYNNDPTRFIPVADFTGLDNALHTTFDALAGIQSVQYTATLPAGFTVGPITTQGVTVANGVLTWNAGVISGTTVQLPIALTAPANFCGTAATLTSQSLTYLNSGANASLDLPDQSIASTVSCDVTGPVITPTITGTHSGDWYSSDVTLHWSVTDPESAVSSQSGCADVTINTNTDANGTTITCSATSGGGNSTQSVTIKRDATVPTVTHSVSGTTGTGGWFTGDATVTFTVQYGPSGKGSETSCGAQAVTTDGTTTVTCQATSAAGLTGQDNAVVKRDASAPTVTPSISGTQGNNGWYVSDVQLHWNVSDPTSGVASTVGCADASLTHDGVAVASTCSATNGAGEVGSNAVTLKRDATKPVITISGNAGSYAVDQTIAITCSATDATSGVASSTCGNVNGAAYTFTTGAHSYTAQATDNAGNVATSTYGFTVNVTVDGIIGLINRFVSGNDVAVLTTRVRNIADKLGKNSPALDSQMKNFQKELDKAQQDGQLSAANATILWNLVQLLQ